LLYIYIMFEIGNYRCSFKRNEDSIYLKFTDKTTYDIYSRNIDINIIEEEIKNKYILTLDNLVYVFNNNLNAENVIFVKDFDKMVLYFNKTYKFSLVLYNENICLNENKETLIIRDLKSRTRELENRTHELEKEIEILKNNDRPYIMDIGICKGCVRYKGDMKKYKVNSSFKKFYISSMGEDYIIPNYITDEYLHLFTFQTPILTTLKIKKHKINSRNFTYDGLTFSCSFLLKQVKDEI